MEFTASNPTQSQWDPLEIMENRTPSKGCLKRIRSDLKALYNDPLPLIYAFQDDANATVVHALIIGPFDTPYEGGFFYFILNFLDDYPQSPPKVRLMTTDGGKVRFNPNR